MAGQTEIAIICVGEGGGKEKDLTLQSAVILNSWKRRISLALKVQITRMAVGVLCNLQQVLNYSISSRPSPVPRCSDGIAT